MKIIDLVMLWSVCAIVGNSLQLNWLQSGGFCGALTWLFIRLRDKS
jgi:hypothetical protein